MKFFNKNIIITGGSAGIGAATAQLFAREGANVYVLDLQPLTYHQEKTIFLACDISKPEQVALAVAEICSSTDKIDFLFCNAGTHLFANIEETSIEDLNRVVNTNLLGTFYSLQQVLPLMRKYNNGAIVLMGSDQAFVAKEQCAIYGATKAAIAQLAKSTAIDYAPYNIRVNCICPGTIDTSLYRNVIKHLVAKTGATEADIQQAIEQKLPMKRIGQPEEVAKVVSLLCSDESSFMTGALVSVDGGYTAQ